MSNTAINALKKIRALRNYNASNALPQAGLAEQKILKSLNLTDLTSVITALESDGSVSNG
jgi:hypothetical protein